MESKRDIDQIIEKVEKVFLQSNVHQSKGTGHADDDGISYFWLSGSSLMMFMLKIPTANVYF